MKVFLTILVLILFSVATKGQSLSQPHSYSDSLLVKGESLAIAYDKRKKIYWATGISAYSAMATGLYFAWYKQYDQEAFHLFNDWNEWSNMDKVGHVFSAYFQADVIYEAGKWAGFSENKALGIASLASLWGQLNIELMDGFSSKWGFSIPDIASNLLGTGLFYTQQKLWKQQKLRMKMSYWPINYSKSAIISESGMFLSSPFNRSRDLYGTGFMERFLKDYNGQTIWISGNLSSFFPKSRLPKFMSLALGFSVQNLYGGYDNRWEKNGEFYELDSGLFPRSSQFVLALDYDLLKIRAKSGFARSLLKFLNIFKLPAPAVSYDTQQGWRLHLLYLN